MFAKFSWPHHFCIFASFFNVFKQITHNGFSLFSPEDTKPNLKYSYLYFLCLSVHMKFVYLPTRFCKYNVEDSDVADDSTLSVTIILLLSPVCDLSLPHLNNHLSILRIIIILIIELKITHKKEIITD